jgi:signal transduction histidine kinase/CheY-like chemotaxis protein
MDSEFPSYDATRKPWYQWHEPVVLQQQVALMRRNFPVTLLASFAAAVGTVWALHTLVAPEALWLWLASHLAVLAVVYALVRWYLDAAREPIANAWTLVLCMAVMGLSWGTLAYVAVRYGPADSILYAMAIIGGVSSGALGLGASLFPAYLAYLLWPVGTVAVAFVYLGGPIFVPLSGLTLVYFALTCAQARAAEEVIRRGIQLQIDNATLVQRLRKESGQAKAALDVAKAAQLLAQQTQAAAEKANTDKSKFLAAASHDLRQPLHAMGLFIEALSRSELSEHQLVVLDHAHAASSAASEMLTTLLDFSRLEAGVVKSQPKPFLLQPLLAQLEQEFGLQADARELVYRTRETSLAVVADPNLTDLVLRNFISNAIRYTDKGGVLVGCRQRGDAVVVEVWDTGMGIADDQHTEVFKEFHQLGNPERDRRKGLGLGLAIVERISTAMDAQVTLRSVPGRGSVFRLWLKAYAGPVADEQGTQLHSKNLQGMRVLVIDDEEPVRVGMQELLGSWGCICYSADAVSSALQCVALLSMEEQPEVILADYRLREGATGGQAISALRAYLTMRGLQDALPAIIITGDTAPERIREARSTDAMLLHKPVSANALQQALLQLR